MYKTWRGSGMRAIAKICVGLLRSLVSHFFRIPIALLSHPLNFRAKQNSNPEKMRRVLKRCDTTLQGSRISNFFAKSIYQAISFRFNIVIFCQSHIMGINCFTNNHQIRQKSLLNIAHILSHCVIFIKIFSIVKVYSSYTLLRKVMTCKDWNVR